MAGSEGSRGTASDFRFGLRKVAGIGRDELDA